MFWIIDFGAGYDDTPLPHADVEISCAEDYEVSARVILVSAMAHKIHLYIEKLVAKLIYC